MKIRFNKKVQIIPDWNDNSFHYHGGFDYDLNGYTQISFMLTIDLVGERWEGDYLSPPEVTFECDIDVDAIRLWIDEVEQELSPEEIKQLEKEILENVTWE